MGCVEELSCSECGEIPARWRLDDRLAVTKSHQYSEMIIRTIKGK